MEKQKCNMCGEIKPWNEFIKNSGYKSGYNHRCKPCSRLYEKIKREQELDPKISPLDYCNDESVRKDAEKVLRSLGYELYNSKNPVWKQLDERIATKYEKI